MVRLSAFVAGGIQAEQPRERLMHTAALSSSLNAHLYVINGLRSHRVKLCSNNELLWVKYTKSDVETH